MSRRSEGVGEWLILIDCSCPDLDSRPDLGRPVSALSGSSDTGVNRSKVAAWKVDIPQDLPLKYSGAKL